MRSPVKAAALSTLLAASAAGSATAQEQNTLADIHQIEKCLPMALRSVQATQGSDAFRDTPIRQSFVTPMNFQSHSIRSVRHDGSTAESTELTASWNNIGDRYKTGEDTVTFTADIERPPKVSVTATFTFAFDRDGVVPYQEDRISDNTSTYHVARPKEGPEMPEIEDILINDHSDAYSPLVAPDDFENPHRIMQETIVALSQYFSLCMEFNKPPVGGYDVPSPNLYNIPSDPKMDMAMEG